jgi:hypothetical protein
MDRGRRLLVTVTSVLAGVTSSRVALASPSSGPGSGALARLPRRPRGIPEFVLEIAVLIVPVEVRDDQCCRGAGIIAVALADGHRIDRGPQPEDGCGSARQRARTVGIADLRGDGLQTAGRIPRGRGRARRSQRACIFMAAADSFTAPPPGAIHSSVIGPSGTKTCPGGRLPLAPDCAACGSRLDPRVRARHGTVRC